MAHTKGVAGKEIFKGGIPQGFSAECPICHTVNEAHYANNRLIWWRNDEYGMWCEHATGCYEGSQTVQFLFA